MEIGAIFLTLAVLLLAVLFISKPFLFPVKEHKAGSENARISALLADKDRYLGLIQELEQDHSLGRITDEDYPAMRSDLILKASNTLRKIEELDSETPHQTNQAPFTRTVTEQRIELDDLLAKRRAQKKDRTDGFCPHCGKPVIKSDKFCSHCGKKIEK